MQQTLSHALDQLLGRTSGPLYLRFILQPVVATIIGVRAGLIDARERRPAFLWTLISKRTQRRELLSSGWKDIGKVFTIAVLIDSIYQSVILHWLYPLQALLVAFVLAIVPYVAVRGPTSRVVSRGVGHSDTA